MYPNDFIAYVSETYRRMDDIKEAERYRLVKECESDEKQTNFAAYLPNLLAALAAFFLKYRV